MDRQTTWNQSPLFAALDLGINFLDTSASYGKGHNHRVIGEAIRGRRRDVVIHSKSGSPRDGSPDAVRGGGDPRYLRQTCEQSLKNLGIETHRAPAAATLALSFGSNLDRLIGPANSISPRPEETGMAGDNIRRVAAIGTGTFLFSGRAAYCTEVPR